MDSHDIIFLTLPICPKCTTMKRRLDKIVQDHPEIKVEERSLLSNIGFARENGILTVPAMIVKGKPIRGVVPEKDILDALGV
jgi:glutaredoxin